VSPYLALGVRASLAADPQAVPRSPFLSLDLTGQTYIDYLNRRSLHLARLPEVRRRLRRVAPFCNVPISHRVFCASSTRLARARMLLMFFRMNARTRHKVVVVGVDYSETGALALRQALEIASPAPGGEVHAVHVPRAIRRASARARPGDVASVARSRRGQDRARALSRSHRR
jgi:hypothetical protein